MNRQQRLLRVEPDENLVFRFEERGRASSTFRIWNNTDSFVAFKVKTTDPRRFSGTSIYGVLQPGSYHDVKVSMHGQEEASGDRVIIKSLVANQNNTENSLRRLAGKFCQLPSLGAILSLSVLHLSITKLSFREREATADNHKLRVVYAKQPWKMFRRAIFFAFSCLVFWFLTMAILSRIWTLIYGVTVLVLRMMRVRALDAAEEWIGRTLLYLGLLFLSAAREHVLDLCFGWLRAIYEAFLALCDYLFAFLFEPEERRPRYRN